MQKRAISAKRNNYFQPKLRDAEKCAIGTLQAWENMQRRSSEEKHKTR